MIDTVEITTDNNVRVELSGKGYLSIYVDGNYINVDNDEFGYIVELVRIARGVINE